MLKMQTNREDQNIWATISDDKLQEPKLTLWATLVFENRPDKLSYKIRKAEKMPND